VILNTKAQKAALDDALFAEQIKLLFNERFDLVANVVVASALAAILGRLFAPWIWIAWLTSVWLVILGRAAMPYRRLVALPGAGSGRKAVRLYLVAKFVTACLWGLTGSVVLVTADPLDHVFIVFVLAGMVAGGIVRNAAFQPAMVAFILPAMTPVIVMLLSSPNAAAFDLGAIVAIFAVVLGGSGLNINRTIVESLRSRVEQELLVVKLTASEASMAEAQRLAHVGGFEIDVASGEIVPTAEAFRIMGVDPSTFVASVESLVARVYPIDRPAVRTSLEMFLRTGESHFLEYRIVRDDGEIRFMESTGRKSGAMPGQPSTLFASIQDVTERKYAANELAYRDRLLDAVTAGTAILLLAGSIDSGMPEALRTVGESMHLDSIEVVAEAPELASTLALRYAWEALPDSRHFDVASFQTPPAPAPVMSAIRALLRDGKILIGQRADADGGGLLHSLLERLQAESLLLVPIVVDGELWGTLGANLSREAHVWSANEINTLKTFASILGALALRDQQRQSLEFANLLLKTEMEASPDGILVVDGDRKILSVNQRFIDMWGPEIGSAHSYEARAAATAAAVIEDSHRFAERIEFLYAHPDDTGNDELEFRDGRFIDRRTAVLASPDGTYLGRVWYFRDISTRKRAELRAIEMANFDVLTGLTNRSVFVELLGQAIAEADRVKKTFAVIYLNLDRFKDINDTLGHPVGDGLLRAVANRLRTNMRPGDTVARFGGDEFAVLVADLEDPAVAGFVAEKLLVALAVPFEVGEREIRTGGSIGIDVYGPDSTQAETLLTHADMALHRAKSEARGGYRFFTDAMDKDVRTRVTLGAELRSAVAAGQLFLQYQPQVAIETGRIIGVEALVRWRHPVRGVLGPNLFIPVAESTGIIVELGRWVLLTACRQARSWLDAGIAPVRVAVNVSGLQFKTPLELEGDVTGALAEARLPPELLEIELTETVLMNVSLEHSDALARLRESGVTFAIDDFGTGYSSLGYLGLFPVDRIKIAREFVKDITTVPAQAAVAKATIGLARDLGIAVIAEGVETREQLEVLRSLGCAEIQGYYFAKPRDAEDLTRVFRSGGVLAHQEVPVGS
jgi:diguanylate cyclase (GGDEF)-like protein/PAS domain S-box-containing protein